MKKTIVIAFMAGFLSSFVGGSLGVIASSAYAGERDERVFVYGTLLNPVTRTYACKCLVSLEATTLEGYAKTYRDLIPARNSHVRGGIILVNDRELANLDQYENVPEQYVREKLMVEDESAWVYFKTDQSEE